MPSILISFGFKNGAPSEHERRMILDVRQWLNRNPYRDRKLRNLRGTDPAVIADIEQTPGLEEAYHQLRECVAVFDGDVYLGCTGGHHRSVYLAERLGRDLNVPVFHRDIDTRKAREIPVGATICAHNVEPYNCGVCFPRKK